MKEKVLQEITEKRDRYTKHFMLPEKGTAAAVYPEPVHYETESGSRTGIRMETELCAASGHNRNQRISLCIHR